MYAYRWKDIPAARLSADKTLQPKETQFFANFCVLFSRHRLHLFLYFVVNEEIYLLARCLQIVLKCFNCI